MTTTRGPLTDAQLRDSLRELAVGPDASALTAEVLRSVGATRQLRRVPWPAFEDHRRAVLVGIAAVLAVGLLGALIIAGGLHDAPTPVRGGPLQLVVQASNGLRDPAFRVSHTVFPAGSGVETRLDGLPSSAVGLRWSPDGTRLAYFVEDAPPQLHSLDLTALFLANRDGTNPVRLVLPRSIDQYVSNGFWAGVKWAPTSDRFMLPWSTYTCAVDPDCVPEGGVDVFDRNGVVIATVSTPNNVDIDASWSPDGRAVGWTSGSCVDSACSMSAFSWRRIDGDPTVTTLQLPGVQQVAWSSGRLLVVQVVGDTLDLVFRMAPDGTNVSLVPWDAKPSEAGPVWSPDGRRLAALDWTAGTLRLRDVSAGTEVVAPVPTGSGFAAWAPDGSRLILYGDSSISTAGYSFFSIGADGSGLISLGNGDDFGWLPR